MEEYVICNKEDLMTLANSVRAAQESTYTYNVPELTTVASQIIENSESPTAVLYTSQLLNEEQKQQARENIGAAGQEEVDRLSEEKLDKYNLPINRLSAEGEQIGYALNKNTGEVYPMSGYRVSGYCDVGTDNPHRTITIRGLSGNPRCCFYDSEKAYISTIEGAVVQTDFITLPDNAKYVRVQSTSEFAAALVNIGVDDEYHAPTERTEVAIPKKTSDLINDEQYFSAKVDGTIKAQHVDFTIGSANLLDESQIVQGYFVWHHNGTLSANASFAVTEEYIDISNNKGSIVALKYSNNSAEVPDGSFHRCAFYDADKVFISGVSNGASVPSDPTTGIVTVPENAKYIRVSWLASSKYHLIAYGDSTNIPYVRYGNKDANPESLYDAVEKLKTVISKWNGLTWLSYGDSITAQGNNGGGYQNIVDDMLGFGASYRRGVGGQTYKANTSTFYANADGSYAGRYGMGGLTEAPEGTTTHLGYFASWDRITTMIPESIRESIDLVVLCGGTNDHGSVEDVETDGVISAGTPVWVPNSTVDAHWGASEHYAGGDYDIGTFAGAIASTIAKMRAWCPNAVVVLATPYPRWDTATMQQYTNSKGLDFREMCEIQIATAKYMGCPVCDANALSGISAANFAGTVSDGVHPNTAGVKLYGKALADCLGVISPKIV